MTLENGERWTKMCVCTNKTYKNVSFYAFAKDRAIHIERLVSYENNIFLNSCIIIFKTL